MRRFGTGLPMLLSDSVVSVSFKPGANEEWVERGGLRDFLLVSWATHPNRAGNPTKLRSRKL